MGNAISEQHPAVVLRSQYRQLRSLLAVAMIAVVGLTAAVVILATNDESTTQLGSASQVISQNPADAARSDGGPEESAVAASIGTQPTVAGPDESSVAAAIGTADDRATGGPDESIVAGAVSGR
jgi:hypothetical protein